MPIFFQLNVVDLLTVNFSAPKTGNIEININNNDSTDMMIPNHFPSIKYKREWSDLKEKIHQ